MAEVDPALADPTPAGDMADRADAWRIAVKLIKDAGLAHDADTDETLALATFIYRG